MDGYKTAADGYPNIFDIIERISAGYLMNTMDFGKLHVVAGVRFEGTQMNTLGYNVTLYPAGSKNCPTRHRLRNAGSRPQQSLLTSTCCPASRSATLSTTNPASAWSMPAASSRPDAYQLVPYVTEDDSTNPATIAQGNPALKPEHANNYDLLYERYLNPAGILPGRLLLSSNSPTR